jgi:adenylate cyclase
VSDSDALQRAQQTMRRFQHEVRTPLGQIIGYSELLEDELEERGQEDLVPDLHRIRAAAKRLLDLVDGKLQSSETPVGAPELPAPKTEPATEPSGDGVVAADSNTPDSETNPAPDVAEENPRILVVDDDAQNRDVLRRRLERNGFDVEAASGGIEMLRRIDGDEFDLILLDVMMPGMNGLEALERVRRTRSMSELPVILATALADTDDAVEGLGRGANDYVTKPFDYPMLIARVRTQLEVSRSVRQTAALSRQLEFRNSFIREALGREVSPDLLVEMAETPGALDLGNEERTISAVVADIRGCRRLAETLSPAQYVALIRNTLTGLAAVVEHYVGTVDSIAGDSLTAVFGLPDATDKDAAQAAACAIALQLEMHAINERNAGLQLPAVQIGVGIATGDVVVGGFGSGDMMRFKAIGEPFVTASRIESGASGDEVWICEVTRERVGDLAEIDRQRDIGDHRAHRLLGVGGEWLMSLRAVPGSS